MSGFRIDEIELNWVSTDKYKLNVICNKGVTEVASPLSVKLSPNPADKALEVDITGLNRSHRLAFEVPVVVFDQLFGRKDYLDILFVDTAAGFPLKTDVAGVVIKDTDYPPPYSIAFADKQSYLTSGHKQLSGMFLIKKLLVSRVGQTNAFDVHITLEYSRILFDVFSVSGKEEVDPERSTPGVLQLIAGLVELNLNPTAGSSGTKQISFNVQNGLKPGTSGFSLLLKTNLITDWKQFDTKKGSVYIK